MQAEMEKTEQEENGFIDITDNLKIIVGVALLFIINYMFALYVELKPYQTAPL
ncbi:hypothetical protein NEAUS03_1791 [Nematocida ausubeli]|nr:hypothetical protein NEAUS03_1791 [Nematocida ausubeli]